MTKFTLVYDVVTDVTFDDPSVIENKGESIGDMIFISDSGEDGTWLGISGGSKARVSGTMKIKQNYTKEAIIPVCKALVQSLDLGGLYTMSGENADNPDKVFTEITLATEDNLEELQDKEPTVTVDDLLFEFEKKDGSKGYTVIPLDKFVDKGAYIKHYPHATDKSIIVFETLNEEKKELDLTWFNNGNSRHLKESEINPAKAGKPTIAEVQAFIDNNTDILSGVLYYTGTETATDEFKQTYFLTNNRTVIPLGAGMSDESDAIEQWQGGVEYQPGEIFWIIPTEENTKNIDDEELVQNEKYLAYYDGNTVVETPETLSVTEIAKMKTSAFEELTASKLTLWELYNKDLEKYGEVKPKDLHAIFYNRQHFIPNHTENKMLKAGELLFIGDPIEEIWLLDASFNGGIANVVFDETYYNDTGEWRLDPNAMGAGDLRRVFKKDTTKLSILGLDSETITPTPVDKYRPTSTEIKAAVDALNLKDNLLITYKLKSTDGIHIQQWMKIGDVYQLVDENVPGMDEVDEWLPDHTYESQQLFKFSTDLYGTTKDGVLLTPGEMYLGYYDTETTSSDVVKNDIPKIKVIQSRNNLFTNHRYRDPKYLNLIKMPREGQTESIPYVNRLEYWTFSRHATEGIAPDDGTPGKWIPKRDNITAFYHMVADKHQAPTYHLVESNFINSRWITAEDVNHTITFEKSGTYNIDWRDVYSSNSEARWLRWKINDGSLESAREAFNNPNLTQGELDAMFYRYLPPVTNSGYVDWSKDGYVTIKVDNLYIKEGTVITIEGNAFSWGGDWFLAYLYIDGVVGLKSINTSGANSGQYLGNVETIADMLNLKATENGEEVDPSTGDFAYLSKDDIGNGDAENPQYPIGYYRKDNDGTFVLDHTISTQSYELLKEVDLKQINNPKEGTCSPQELNKVFPKIRKDTFDGDYKEVIYLPSTNEIMMKHPLYDLDFIFMNQIDTKVHDSTDQPTGYLIPKDEDILAFANDRNYREKILYWGNGNSSNVPAIMMWLITKSGKLQCIRDGLPNQSMTLVTNQDYNIDNKILRIIGLENERLSATIAGVETDLDCTKTGVFTFGVETLGDVQDRFRFHIDGIEISPERLSRLGLNTVGLDLTDILATNTIYAGTKISITTKGA